MNKIIEIYNLLEKLAVLVKELAGGEADAAPQKEEKAPTFEEVRGFLAEISRSGKTAEMKALLSKYGAVKLSDVKEKDFPSLLKDAKELADA